MKLAFSHLSFVNTPLLPCRRTKLSFLTTTPPPMASSAKVVAEYARSGRSSCKGCSAPIAAHALRLGLVAKDPRGYETTKWHHLGCFAKKSKAPISVDSINGYALLRPEDQEALKGFANGGEQKEEETVKKSPSKKKKASNNNGGGDNEEASVKVKPLKKSKELSNDGGEENVGSEVELSESDVKSEYKGIELAPKWKSFKTVIFLEKDEGLKDSSKIAAFDFDGCLAKTSVKKVGADAWSLMYSSIPKKLKELYEDGYKVVVFTNEANIERWKNKRVEAIESKIGRLNGFIEKVEVPVQVFIACGYGLDDGFRKPNVGMWRLMQKYFNSGIEVDMDESFYVGDAAGRKGDHGDADSKFAETIGLKFHVPEDYFGA